MRILGRWCADCTDEDHHSAAVCSSRPKSREDRNGICPRSPLWTTPVAEESWVHRGRGGNAGTGNRGQHCDLQPDRRADVEIPAGTEPAGTCFTEVERAQEARLSQLQFLW